MRLLEKIKRRLGNFVHPKKEFLPAKAYDLWASTYDEQTDNPIVYLNEIVVNDLLENINLENKIIVDIGCGTGSHWGKILAKKPNELIGYEVSNEMLNKLHKKFPHARTYITYDNSLNELGDAYCDVIVCTLVIGYIKDLSKVFTEWNRVLKNKGEIIIVDFHPSALEKGASRSFKHKDELIFIKNYIHSFNKIKTFANKMNWEKVDLIEKKVDHSIKFFYEKLNAIDIYNKSYNTSILYGMHLKKL